MDRFRYPHCNRFVHGVLVRRQGSRSITAPRVEGAAVGPPEVDGFPRASAASRFVGIRLSRRARAVAVTARAPWFMTTGFVRLAHAWLDRIAPGTPLRALRDLWRGDVRLDPIVIVSHHFMKSRGNDNRAWP